MRLGFTAALLVVALLAAANSADAYPQFQFATGNSRCQDCHFSPVGGGLINDWGRSEAGDTISRGGDGSFLHGVWTPPDWVQFGADFRYAALAKRVGDSPPRFVHFPMQGDTYVRFAWRSFSAYLGFGPRAAARTPRQSALRRMVSREHFLTWQPDTSGIYVRLGRFIAPFGLRQPDHTTYTRKYTGHHVLEETYNASVGYLGSDWELHGTAFMPADRFTSAGPREKGTTFLGEKRLLEDKAAIGGQLRFGVGDDSNRYTAGVNGKYYYEELSLLALAEIDLIRQTFKNDIGPSRQQLASYLGVTHWPTQGLMVTGAFERFDEDLGVRATFRDALRLDLQFFPRAHWEVHATTKLEFQGDYGDPSLLALLMAHYYL